MPDAQMDVRIGAQIGDLIAGLNRAKQEIEGLRAPVDHFVESLRDLGEVTGITFALEKLKDFVEEVAEAAEKVDILADAFNVSAERMLAFQNTLDVLGGSGQSLIRLAQKALTRPASPPAQR